MATCTIDERTGHEYAIAVEGGKFTAQRVIYDEDGRSTVEELGPPRTSGAMAVADIRTHFPDYEPHPIAKRLYGTK
jgi:hypothetical protein